MIQTYTAFCQEASGTGTIWIDTVEAESLDAAIISARAACAEDWGADIFAPEDIHVLGVAEGDTTILYWRDLNDN